ncbi:MAG: hypothetical protein H0X39_00255 [Actinobacteria bacterium]|nr:hypothetical protein [Actinomycetota bacterium]
MADNVVIPTTGTGDATPTIAADDIAGVKHQRVKISVGADGSATDLSSANPMPVSGPLTDTQLRATPVPVSGTLGSTGLTDTQLRASAVAVGSVTLAQDSTVSTGNSSAAQSASALGTTSDAAASTTGSVIAQLRRIANLLAGTLGISGTVTANLGTIAGVATAVKQAAFGIAGTPSADVYTVQGSASGTPLNVSGSFSAAGTTDLNASGTLAATGNVAITTLNGMSTCDVDINGSIAGMTVVAEATIDGTNWFSVFRGYDATVTGTGANWGAGSQYGVAGRYTVNVAGFSGFRVRVSSYTSGSTTITLRASAATGPIGITLPLPVGSNIIGALVADQTVNLSRIGGTATDVNSGNKSAGTQRIVLATDQPNLTTPLNVAIGGALAAGTNVIGKVGIDQTTPGTTNLVALAANQSVNQVQVGGTAVAVNSGVLSAGVQRVTLATDQVNLTTPLNVSNKTATTGGMTTHSLVSAASTNGTSVKASAGQVYLMAVSNANAAARYFKLYNKASAPTVGTDTPVWRMMIPAGGGFTINAADLGLVFGTGIAYAITTGAADSDTGAVAASEILVNLGYA